MRRWLHFGDPNKLPEFNGVYARYSDGTLIKLDRVENYTSVWLDFEGSISLSTAAQANSNLHWYVSQQPTITLDGKKLNAFILKGGESKQYGFPKWLIRYFVSTKDLEGNPFNESLRVRSRIVGLLYNSRALNWPEHQTGLVLSSLALNNAAIRSD